EEAVEFEARATAQRAQVALRVVTLHALDEPELRRRLSCIEARMDSRLRLEARLLPNSHPEQLHEQAGVVPHAPRARAALKPFKDAQERLVCEARCERLDNRKCAGILGTQLPNRGGDLALGRSVCRLKHDRDES